MYAKKTKMSIEKLFVYICGNICLLGSEVIFYLVWLISGAEIHPAYAAGSDRSGGITDDQFAIDDGADALWGLVLAGQTFHEQGC